MCFCMVQPHSRKFRKLVAAWIWRHGLHRIPAPERWPPSNVIADHPLGVSPRSVPVVPDLAQDFPAKGVVPPFADAHRTQPTPLTTAQVLNRGGPPRAVRIRGRVSTVANPATSQRTAERRKTRYTSTCPAPLHPPRKVPVTPRADVVLVMEDVDVTAAEEPVARKTRSGEGWG